MNKLEEIVAKWIAGLDSIFNNAVKSIKLELKIIEEKEKLPKGLSSLNFGDLKLDILFQANMAAQGYDTLDDVNNEAIQKAKSVVKIAIDAFNKLLPQGEDFYKEVKDQLPNSDFRDALDKAIKRRDELQKYLGN